MTRRRARAAAGHIAISPPKATMAPPSQIHSTSGETMSLKLAGGGAAS